MDSNKIYCVEGLGGEIFAWLRSPMKEAGFEVVWYPWWWVPKLPDGIVLVGHSLGGGKVIRLVNEEKVKPRLLVTLDPRVEPEGGYELEPSGRTALNFYQTGFMPGSFVKNADNYLLDARHTAIPSLKIVINKIKECM